MVVGCEGKGEVESLRNIHPSHRDTLGFRGRDKPMAIHCQAMRTIIALGDLISSVIVR